MQALRLDVGYDKLFKGLSVNVKRATASVTKQLSQMRPNMIQHAQIELVVCKN